jgi:hypothetical protein
MCPLCFDQSSLDIIDQTGITEKTMDLLDELLVEAMNLGSRMTAGEHIAGDPLRMQKYTLAQYVANLEHCVIGDAKKDVEAFRIALPPLSMIKQPEISS